MEEYERGTCLSIWRTADARPTWTEAVGQVASHKREQQEAQLIARLSILASRGVLRSPDHIRAEGQGIFAVKTNGGLRAYGWHSNIDGRRAFVISHVVLKKTDKLNPADLNRAVACREAVEAELRTRG
jgi:hypothetical protein